MSEEQKMVLQMVEGGKITPEEAERLLRAMSPSPNAPERRAADLPAATRGDAGLAETSGPSLRALLATVDLSGVNLCGTRLDGANLTGAGLKFANLEDADLTNANLSRARLSHANLQGANLAGANLSEADLSHCNLEGLDLSGMDLSGVNLSHTNLSEVNLPDLLRCLRGAAASTPASVAVAPVVYSGDPRPTIHLEAPPVPPHGPSGGPEPPAQPGWRGADQVRRGQ